MNERVEQNQHTTTNKTANWARFNALPPLYLITTGQHQQRQRQVSQYNSDNNSNNNKRVSYKRWIKINKGTLSLLALISLEPVWPEIRQRSVWALFICRNPVSISIVSSSHSFSSSSSSSSASSSFQSNAVLHLNFALAQQSNKS